MDCLVILVNYHCADLILKAVESIAADPECDWIHVVDNSEDAAETALLQEKLPPKARLIVSPDNIGFGRACNLALEGLQPDAVLLLNPDATLRPGALRQLKETLLANKKIGAIGPRVYWDEDEHFLMPPSTYPSRLNFLVEHLGRRWPWIEKVRATNFRNTSIKYWTCKKPVRVTALSGGHVLLRYQALVDVNGLFDSRFFMYWEDTDLMRRMSDRRWQLWMEPRAHAVHAYVHSQSKDLMLAVGWDVYQDQYFSNVFWRWLKEFCSNASVLRAPNFIRIQPAENSDLRLDMPERENCAWLMEISPSQAFIPSIGFFGYGIKAVIPGHLVTRLMGRDYYVRIKNLNNKTGFTSYFVFSN